MIGTQFKTRLSIYLSLFLSILLTGLLPISATASSLTAISACAKAAGDNSLDSKRVSVRASPNQTKSSIKVPPETALVVHDLIPFQASEVFDNIADPAKGRDHDTYKVDTTAFRGVIKFVNSFGAAIAEPYRGFYSKLSRDSKVFMANPGSEGFLYNMKTGELEPVPVIKQRWQSALTETVNSYSGRVSHELQKLIKQVESELPELGSVQVLITLPDLTTVTGVVRQFVSNSRLQEQFSFFQQGGRLKPGFLDLPVERLCEKRGINKPKILKELRDKYKSINEWGKFRIEGTSLQRRLTKKVIKDYLIESAKVASSNEGIYVAHVATLEHARLYERDYGFQIAEKMDLTPWYLKLLDEGTITLEEFEAANKTEYLLAVLPAVMAEKLSQATP